MIRKLYVPAGVTSNLFASLLPFLSDYEIYGSVRPTSDQNRVQALKDAKVAIIPFENGLRYANQFDRILWLSTHDDTKALKVFADNAPTVAISSGAIMDYFLGNQTEETLTSYQKSKLALARVPGLVTLIPGFYIEDTRVPQWASKGLHGKTNKKLFSKSLYSGDDFNWAKIYSVTPKSFIVKALMEFLNHPETFPKNKPVIVSTDRQYRRYELRDLVGDDKEPYSRKVLKVIEENPPKLQQIYRNFPHATDSSGKQLFVTEDMVKSAVNKAYSYLN